MQQHSFKPGQRWVSDGERDLGLGEILDVDARSVSVAFPAVGLQRQYAVVNAPLTRIIFSPDDQIRDDHGASLVVEDVIENEGFLIYACRSENGEKVNLPETRINSAMQFNRPQDRLFSGSVDPDKWFDLRKKTLAIKSGLQQSTLQGLIGARVDVIPHQLYIASEVGGRHAPRVLLADEVGLGKTIEAGLILHRQIQSEQVARALILLPDALVHQWLVEMLRRFNLQFSVFDEERCLETPEGNPFETSQLIIASLDFFMNSELRRQQAAKAGWDMLIVDEAHHLHWTEQEASDEYRFVEQLASVTPSLLLLTATPEQLGVSSHFARLRLLDAARFHSLAEFLEEEKNYEPVAKAASALIDGKLLTKEQRLWLTTALPELESGIEPLNRRLPDPATRDQIIQALLDRHGTSRVLFRNTRETISGFPERHLLRGKLAAPKQYADLCWGESALKPELAWKASGQSESWTAFDPRAEWLVGLIESQPQKKILIICAESETAIDLEHELRVRHALRSAAFHEGLSMVARDRAAAWFADPDENAQCLVCSEIGSEGRNFQFSHHLVLFDLPLNPDLLEQRIGRLDRIGQKHPIRIHVPYFAHSAQEQLLDWYHKGLNAFEKTCPTGASIFEKIEPELLKVLRGTSSSAPLISKTRDMDIDLRQQLQAGRDKLLELSSFRPEIGTKIAAEIQSTEKPDDLIEYLEQVCDCYNVNLSDHSSGSYRIRPGDHMRVTHFPGLSERGFIFTPSRKLSVSREDMQFMTWEHPLMTGAIDLILSDETGNAVFTVVDSDALPAGTVLVETSHLLSPVALPEMALHRFLPITTFDICMDIQGRNLTNKISCDDLVSIAEKIPAELMKSFISNNEQKIKACITASIALAEQQSSDVRQQALIKMKKSLNYEFQRLTELRRRNAFIRQDEIAFISQQRQQLEERIQSARTRLDGIRLILVR